MRVVVRNYVCRHGEMDLIALDGECVVFVEVRSTGTDDLSRPAESVDPAKQRRLTDIALDFLRRRGLLERSARFDVLIISWPAGAREPRIVHHRQAFEAVGRWQMFS
jgi:putative endonuclease